MSGHIVKHFNNSTQEAKEDALKTRIRLLALELERVEDKNKRLRRDLVAGRVKAPISYYGENSDDGLHDKEILLGDSAQSLLRSRSQRAIRKVVEAESVANDKEVDMNVVKEMKEDAETKDKFDLLRLVHDISILYPTNKSAEDGSRMRVLYYPNVLGQVTGPFRLSLDKKDGKWVCSTSDLPLPKCILNVQEEFAKLDSGQDGLADLLGKIAILLRALLSRKVQFKMLTENFSSDVMVEPKASEPDYREIRFGLRTLMEEDDEEEGSGSGQTQLIDIKLRYDPESERPPKDVEGSVRIDSQDLGIEHLEELREQCEVFHCLPLCQAINEAL